MMSFNKKSIAPVITMIILLTILCTNVYAASGYQGYAVYRDGVSGQLINQWHAGIMYRAYSTSTKPVIHHPGSGYVTRCTWSQFMKDNEFQGVYEPDDNPSSSERDKFVTMAKKLAGEEIKYNPLYLVYYNLKDAGKWVSPSEVSSMRCDGVVEYIYEYYGFRVYGSSSDWDVSKASFDIREKHSRTNITPKKQVNYLTLVDDDVPN